MVYSTGRFFYVLPCVILFLCCSVILALLLPRLGKRELILCFSYLCSICACLVLSVSSSSGCLGGAAVCDCGTLWTFLLHSHETVRNIMQLQIIYICLVRIVSDNNTVGPDRSV